MPTIHSKDKETEKFVLTLADAQKLGLIPLPLVGGNKYTVFLELLAKAGVIVGGPLYRYGEEEPFFFTNTTLRDWLKEKDIPYHPEHVFANLLWWLRGKNMPKFRMNLYLALGRKTKRGMTHQVVQFDPNAPSSVRQSYKGVWAIAGTPHLFAFLEDSLRGVTKCAAEETLGCEHLIHSRDGGKPLCVSCLSSAVLRSCLGREGDFAVSVAEFYSKLGLENEDQTPFLHVVDNHLYLARETSAIFSSMSQAQTRHFHFLIECLAVIVSNRDAPTQEKQGPIPGVPDLMGLLEEKGLVPPGGLEEVGRIVVQAYSTDPAVVLPREFGWDETHGDIPEQVYGLNMVRCDHGCGGSADFAGGCAAIACHCHREYCRICGGSALNGPDTPDHPHCRCGQFLGRGHCYVEEGQRREADRVFVPPRMDAIIRHIPFSQLESFVGFLRRAHPGLIIPSVIPTPPPVPPPPSDGLQPQPQPIPQSQPRTHSLQALARRAVEIRPELQDIETWLAYYVEEPIPEQRSRILSAAPPEIQVELLRILEL